MIQHVPSRYNMSCGLAAFAMAAEITLEESCKIHRRVPCPPPISDLPGTWGALHPQEMIDAFEELGMDPRFFEKPRLLRTPYWLHPHRTIFATVGGVAQFSHAYVWDPQNRQLWNPNNRPMFSELHKVWVGNRRDVYQNTIWYIQLRNPPRALAA